MLEKLEQISPQLLEVSTSQQTKKRGGKAQDMVKLQ